MTKDDLIKGLREFADFLEARDFIGANFLMGTTMVRADTPEEFKRLARSMGSFNKSADAGYFSAVRRFGEDIKFEVFITRDLVCKKVEVGTRVVPARQGYTIPDEPERVEPLYEYVCPDTVLGGEIGVEAEAK